MIGGFPDLRLTTSYLEEGSWYCASWMRPIVFVHDTLGVEWWAAIVSVSVGLRLLIAPLFFRQVVAGARFQAHAGNTAAFQSRMNALKDDKEALRELLVERRAYFARHGLRMRDILVPTLSQLVVAVSFFWALRRFAYEAHLIPGFLTGGAGSFVALYAPDASVLFGLPGLSMGEGAVRSGLCVLRVASQRPPLPLLIAVLSGSAILLNPNVPGMPAQGLTAGGQRLLFFTLASLFNALFLPYFPAVRAQGRGRSGSGSRAPSLPSPPALSAPAADDAAVHCDHVDFDARAAAPPQGRALPSCHRPPRELAPLRRGA